MTTFNYTPYELYHPPHQPVAVHYNLSSAGGLGPVALNTGRVSLMPPVMGNTSPTQMTPPKSPLHIETDTPRLGQTMMLP